MTGVGFDFCFRNVFRCVNRLHLFEYWNYDFGMEVTGFTRGILTLIIRSSYIRLVFSKNIFLVLDQVCFLMKNSSLYVGFSIEIHVK
jgi:hypothetical protein